MDESFFSALRIVSVMIGSDKSVHVKEREWFLGLLKKYGIPHEELVQLESDLRGETPIEEVYKGITLARDRERLVSWARFAVNLDGKVHFREKEILEKIEQLNRNAGMGEVDTSGYLKALIETQKSIDFWKDMEAIGDFYSQRVRRVRFWGMYPGVQRFKVNLPMKPLIISNIVFLVFIVLLAMGLLTMARN